MIDDAGLLDCRVCPERIPWADVRTAQTIEIQRSCFISREIGSPGRFRRSGLARSNKSAGPADLKIGLGFLDRMHSCFVGGRDPDGAP